MKSWIILPVFLLLSGCYSASEPYSQNGHLEREFGEASRTAWERQILNRDQRHAFRTPTGMEGVHSEEVMNIYHEMYGITPTETNVIQLGVGE